MNFKKALTENRGVKIIALVVALCVWIYAARQNEVEWSRTVPVTLVNVPDSLIVTGNFPEVVNILITCTKWEKTLWRFKRFDLEVDLSQAVPGRHRVVLTPLQIQHIPSEKVEIRSPLALDVRLERLVSRRVQVTLATSGTVPKDFVIIDGSLTITPSWVTVRGPESKVQLIRTVTTETLDLSKIKDSLERELQLEVGQDQTKCEPDHVTVSVAVSALGERVLANVPPTVLIDSDDYAVVVKPSTVTLTLYGPRAVLDTLSSGDVSVLLNLGSLSEARYRMAPEIILPPGLELKAMSVDSLTVEIVENTGAAAP